MSELTSLTLPVWTKFPVTITKIAVTNNQQINKQDQFLTFNYDSLEEVPDSDNSIDDNLNQIFERPKKIYKLPAVFYSPFTGIIKEINVKINDVIDNPAFVIAKIREPCSHSIQFAGLCASCGAIIDDNDNYHKNSITISALENNLKVSLKEAEKSEKKKLLNLISLKKLILVVDLDQTIIHTTVDPTVYKWQNDPSNPNYNVLKDVKSFTLNEDLPFLISRKNNMNKSNKCWYYVKLRPNLKRFLDKISTYYELHIYTMATRSYAKEIAKIIDPDGIYFGDRILSRDESGSLSQKSLTKLFPVDTSMVVIIDDRGDVWDWCPNLIKVIPYDFFIGIGDINSTYLPRQNLLLSPSKRFKEIEQIEEKIMENTQLKISKLINDKPLIDNNENNSKNTTLNNNEINSHDNGNNNNINNIIDNINFYNSNENFNIDKDIISDLEVLKNKEIELERSLSLEVQQNERPLERLQEDLQNLTNSQNIENNDQQNPIEKEIQEKEINGIKEEIRLLYDDDTELESLEKILIKIYNTYYDELKILQPNAFNDIENIIPTMRNEVFKGCYFLFSGIFPTHSDIRDLDTNNWITSFGGEVCRSLTSKVTHLICRNPTTLKARMARHFYKDKVKIVHPDWLFKCVKNWERCDEKEFEFLANDENEIKTSYPVKQADRDLVLDSISESWNGDIDKEIEDFINDSSSDEDDEDGEDEEEAELENKKGARSLVILNGNNKREANDDLQLVGSKKNKTNYDEEESNADDLFAEFEKELDGLIDEDMRS
ncbi:protein serine/threonine phosphatase ASCRUDRAFT_31434 [Ascoidea rubescens DSM 1968]|uniref:RNA polymerase II subunit A C-terminal domain phosphatase n=1 Tax=Ascoidea rubescens DSM 1968 TaxID=1344418 RepID=A0A1D2VNI0_9ASCO|nr:hypothetical protein ASCRUDRAFT_31434 [Ascoidea rubescens DSM 1968]ODV63149.1 hypothetical protein ASCRUDRAFT_31434 [Ascoidea rubescens DSM 1968]